jgi:hypothetical protein
VSLATTASFNGGLESHPDSRRRHPVHEVADGMLGIRLVSVLMIAIVRMGVTPVPVLRLLPLIRL